MHTFQARFLVSRSATSQPGLRRVVTLPHREDTAIVRLRIVMMAMKRATLTTARPMLMQRALSTSFADLELSMWQKGASAYAKTFGNVTAQAAVRRYTSTLDLCRPTTNPAF